VPVLLSAQEWWTKWQSLTGPKSPRVKDQVLTTGETTTTKWNTQQLFYSSVVTPAEILSPLNCEMLRILELSPLP